jgi:hypothetical protein
LSLLVARTVPPPRLAVASAECTTTAARLSSDAPPCPAPVTGAHMR